MRNHVTIVGNITIDLNKGLSMQTLYDGVESSVTSNPDYIIDGIAIPIVNVECKGIGVISPLGDIKESLSKLYNFSMQSIVEKIWKFLQELIDKLKKFIPFPFDFKLPILDLTIEDLFKSDLYDIIKTKILNLWNTAKDTLKDILAVLNIPWPVYVNVENPGRIIEQMVDSIMRSLWSTVLAMIAKINDWIKTALEIWDAVVNKGAAQAGIIWQKIEDQFLGKIKKLLTEPPTMEEIEKYIIEFAKSVYGKAEVTYTEIMKIIKDFKIPILGIKPFDWNLPLDPHVSVPDLDFKQMVIDIKSWLNNYVVSLVKDFVTAILDFIKKFFGIPFELPILQIPCTFCAVKKILT